MLLKHVNNILKACFQARKVNVLTGRNVFFVQVSVFLSTGCLLIFSILKIFNDRFLVK